MEEVVILGLSIIRFGKLLSVTVHFKNHFKKLKKTANPKMGSNFWNLCAWVIMMHPTHLIIFRADRILVWLLVVFPCKVPLMCGKYMLVYVGSFVVTVTLWIMMVIYDVFTLFLHLYSHWPCCTFYESNFELIQSVVP